MSDILVVGNIISDTYLNLDPDEEGLERGNQGELWLPVCLGLAKNQDFEEGGRHKYFKKARVLAGAEISKEVLLSMNVSAEISGVSESAETSGEDESAKTSEGAGKVVASAGELETSEVNCSELDERFILVADEKVCYFSPRTRKKTIFVEPTEAPRIIFIDRSANLDEAEVKKILAYCQKNQVKLVVHLRSEKLTNMLQLAKKANLTFVENYVSSLDRTRQILLSDEKIEFGSFVEPLNLKRSGFLTHLSELLTMAATILGGTVKGEKLRDCFEMAKLAVEGEELDRNLEFQEIKQKMAAEKVEEKYIKKTVVGAEARHIQENENSLMLSANEQDKLEEIVETMLAPGKGILAADESGGSIKKKFAKLGIPDTYENRRDYRNIFLSTDGLEKYAGGVILFDEAARQFADDGRNFVDYLTAKGVIPGIKVDKGLEKFSDSFPNSQNAGGEIELSKELFNSIQREETWTKGLEGLGERLSEYREMGLKFTKWRAAFEVRKANLDDTSTNDAEKGGIDGQNARNNNLLTPSAGAISVNAEILARYAKIVQAAGMVPIVEPELVFDGDYDILTSGKETGEILDVLFEKLYDNNVWLPGTILKVNMVIAGKKFSKQSTPREVGQATARLLLKHVPKELGGVVFLSGGQSPEQATENLKAVIQAGKDGSNSVGEKPLDGGADRMNAEKNRKVFPWPVTFSFARALQDPALFAWRGDNQNIEEAKKAFFERLKANSEALKG